MRIKVTLLAGFLGLFSGVTPAAAQPSITNGQLQPRAATAAIEREIQTLASQLAEPAWVGYAVPARPGDHQMCCWNGDGGNSGCCTGCRLEPGVASAVTTVRQERPTLLEAGDSFFVLYRIENRQVVRIRMFSEPCPLDAGGRTLHWLTGVREEDSIAFLTTFLGSSSTNRLADSALSAIAMHRHQNALERLLAAAKDGATTHVRGQALFWLAQRAGEQAVGAISNAIANDPETEVKRRAVFALSQLPRSEGVPLLIQVARTNTNPAVRKQAMFWLGQSRDPRALQFFQEILFK
jgi:HEAT repeats